LELAIFGSIILMLLGILVNYGLKYNFQQQLYQHAFRIALQKGSQAVHDNHAQLDPMLIRQTHVPDPSNPWGTGQVIPMIASESAVTRTYRLMGSPEVKAELPETATYFNYSASDYNEPPVESTFKIQGFRKEYDINERQLEKYYFLYGRTNVFTPSKDDWIWDPVFHDYYRACDRCLVTGWREVYASACNIFEGHWGVYDDGLISPIQPERRKYTYCTQRTGSYCTGTCYEEQVGGEQTMDRCDIPLNPDPPPPGAWYFRCVKYRVPMIIVDPFAGHIADKDSMISHCRMIVDPRYCIEQCKKSTLPGERESTDNFSCEDMCAELTNPPSQIYLHPYLGDWGGNTNYEGLLGGAWYCRGYTLDFDYFGNPKFTFPTIEQLFSGTYKGKALGLQPDFSQDYTVNNMLNKTATPSLTTTYDTVNWSSSVSRNVKYINQLDAQGYASPVTGPSTYTNVTNLSDIVFDERWNTITGP
jgi:hypothetical protein